MKAGTSTPQQLCIVHTRHTHLAQSLRTRVMFCPLLAFVRPIETKTIMPLPCHARSSTQTFDEHTTQPAYEQVDRILSASADLPDSSVVWKDRRHG